MCQVCKVAYEDNDKHDQAVQTNIIWFLEYEGKKYLKLSKWFNFNIFNLFEKLLNLHFRFFTCFSFKDRERHMNNAAAIQNLKCYLLA